MMDKEEIFKEIVIHEGPLMAIQLTTILMFVIAIIIEPSPFKIIFLITYTAYVTWIYVRKYKKLKKASETKED